MTVYCCPLFSYRPFHVDRSRTRRRFICRIRHCYRTFTVSPGLWTLARRYWWPPDQPLSFITVVGCAEAVAFVRYRHQAEFLAELRHFKFKFGPHRFRLLLIPPSSSSLLPLRACIGLLVFCCQIKSTITTGTAQLSPHFIKQIKDMTIAGNLQCFFGKIIVRTGVLKSLICNTPLSTADNVTILPGAAFTVTFCFVLWTGGLQQ